MGKPILLGRLLDVLGQHARLYPIFPRVRTTAQSGRATCITLGPNPRAPLPSSGLDSSTRGQVIKVSATDPRVQTATMAQLPTIACLVENNRAAEQACPVTGPGSPQCARCTPMGGGDLPRRRS